MAKRKFETFNYTVAQVWAAAVAANRINGGYVKYDVQADPEKGTPAKLTNKALVWDFLADTQGVVTAEDEAKGSKVREHFQGKVMELLTGSKNDFIASAVRIANRTEFTSADRLDVAIVACLPASYERDMLREEAQAKTFGSKHIGKEKDRIEGEFDIVSCNVSQKFECYVVSAISEGNSFFFFSQHNFEAGKKMKLKGTIKAHRDNGVTQLNRVKRVS